MKRSVLLGLFVTASMMASTSFADGKPADLCDANIQEITNLKAGLSASPEKAQLAETSLSKAQALKQAGKTDDCVAETSKTKLELQKASGTNN
ncbi:hypothetical protein NQ186_04905 [Pseudomonas zeae]|uniref:DUF1090 domain-containing protein n=1 Tax=Pseudomonas zeae TaxID=2745510 RepID=A0ABU5BDQ2_9PSED|nr:MULTISPECIES: hypothetical protein [Pseudomonas]MDX9674773.1 hypothetical protein [Pseudomonas zeae]UUT13521.1 hypothetical protein NQ186_04905 [Pseudomonas zeae]SEO72115.1 hypothetical protein SAMN04487856_11044 [Pseudomonas sp. ok266]